MFVHAYIIFQVVINATEITHDFNTKHQNKCPYTHTHPGICSDSHVLYVLPQQTDAQTRIHAYRLVESCTHAYGDINSHTDILASMRTKARTSYHPQEVTRSHTGKCHEGGAPHEDNRDPRLDLTLSLLLSCTGLGVRRSLASYLGSYLLGNEASCRP